MLKVLIPSGGYFPAKTYGGPAVSIQNLCRLLGDEISFTILAPDYELDGSRIEFNHDSGLNEEDKTNVIYLKKSDENYDVYLKIFNEIRPDVIYFNSLFDYKNTIPFLRIAKINNVRVVLAPRGQLNKGAFKKKWKKLPYLFLFNLMKSSLSVTYQSTCDEETVAIQKYLKVEANKIILLSNIPSIPSKNFAHHKNNDALRIVFFSRIHPKKNVLFALNCLKNFENNAVFDIYGPIEDRNYWNECLNDINSMPKNISINYKGMIDHEQIHNIISKYDLFFFPTFSENYGHVIAESLSSGTPVLISDQTPWNDVELAGVGRAYSLEHSEKFNRFLDYISKINDEEYYQMSLNAVSYFTKKADIEYFKCQYMKLFTK